MIGLSRFWLDFDLTLAQFVVSCRWGQFESRI